MALLAEAFAFLLPEEGGASPFEFPMKGQPAWLGLCSRHQTPLWSTPFPSYFFFSELPLSWPPCPYVHSLQCALCISALCHLTCCSSHDLPVSSSDVTSFISLVFSSHSSHFLPTITFSSSVFFFICPSSPLPFPTFLPSM